VAEDPSEIRQRIETSRDELAETVQQLVAKTDIKARVRDTAAEGARQLEERAEEIGERIRTATPETVEPQSLVLAGIVAAIVAVMLFAFVRRRSR
jgi:predicted Holliday junction resolvase-like endonuclease